MSCTVPKDYHTTNSIDNTHTSVLMTSEFQDVLGDIEAIKAILANYSYADIVDMKSRINDIGSQLAKVEQTLAYLMLMIEKGDDIDWQ